MRPGILGLIWGSVLILGVRCAVLNETDQEVIVTDFDKGKDSVNQLPFWKILSTDISSLKEKVDTLERIDAAGFHSCQDYYHKGINITGDYYISTNQSSDYTLEKVHCDFEAIPYKTCWDHFQQGARENGEYKALIDGRTVTLECDFSEPRAEGLTVFHHDHSDRVVEISHCSEEDCFKHNLTYNSTDRVIKEVISTSQTCYQLFQFDCFLSALNPIGSWVGVDGSKNTFFSGNEGNEICDCGMGNPSANSTNSLYNPAQESSNQCGQQVPYLETRPKCNCDARQPMVTSDRGYITNKKLLPVKSFNYGYMTSKWQKANVTIGPMICSGDCKSRCNETGMTGYCDDELGECICKVGYFGKDCENQVRLNTRQNGAGNRYGYVEMRKSDQTSWKSVWTDDMDANLATLICKNLGYSKGHESFTEQRYKCNNWAPCSDRSERIEITSCPDSNLESCTVADKYDSTYYYSEIKCKQN